MRIEDEARSMAFFVQGALFAGAAQFASPEHSALTQPVTLQQPVGEDGQAQPYFYVTLASGIVVEVRVTGLVPEKPTRFGDLEACFGGPPC